MKDEIARHGKVATLHAHWQSLAVGATPARAQVDPAAIKPLLPYIYIVDFETEPFRVRFRLTGTLADQWNGFSLTGRYLDEFLKHDQYGANRILIDGYQQAFRSGRPVIGQYHWPTRSGYNTVVDFGLFPLTVEGVVAQAISIEDVGDVPIADEFVPFEDPAKKS